MDSDDPEAVDLDGAWRWPRVRRWARERWKHWTTNKGEAVQNVLQFLCAMSLLTFLIS